MKWVRHQESGIIQFIFYLFSFKLGKNQRATGFITIELKYFRYKMWTSNSGNYLFNFATNFFSRLCRVHNDQDHFERVLAKFIPRLLFIENGMQLELIDCQWMFHKSNTEI